MEFALPELFNREDIINILNRRQLHVQNKNELTLDELLRVYKTFVMPLSRRPERCKKMKQLAHSLTAARNTDNEEQDMQIECSDNSCNMDVDFVIEDTFSNEQFRSKDRISPAGEKRRQTISDDDTFEMFKDDYQYQLSSVTKRIRINTLS